MGGPGSWGIMLREVREKEKGRCYLISDVWTLSTFSNWMTHITRITASRVHVDNEAVLSPGSSTEKVTGETTTATRGPPDLLLFL